MRQESARLSSRLFNEFKRKFLHLFILSIPIVYNFFSWWETLLYTFTCLIVAILIEIFRLYVRPHHPMPHNRLEELAQKFDRQIESIAREKERKTCAAHIPFFIAAPIVVAFFEKNTAIAAIVSSLFGDAVAAIIGISMGHHSIPSVPRKTLEGAIGGAVCAFLSALIFINPLGALASALVVFVTDFIDLRKFHLNDNLVNPVLAAILISIFKLIIG